MANNPFDKYGQADPNNPFSKYGLKGTAPKTPQKNALGRSLDELWDQSTTAVGTVLDVLDTPQNALQGAVVEGAEGFKKGLTREKDYNSKDILTKYGWEGDSLAKSGVGLAADVLLDPLNLLGVGAIKKGYQAGVKALGNVADTGLKAVPKVNDAYASVKGFFDPFSKYEGVEGLKDAIRLAESGARSAKHEELTKASLAFMKGKSLTDDLPLLGGKTLSEESRKKLSYALDTGDISKLADEEVDSYYKVKDLFDERWASEKASGHQAKAPKVKNYFPYMTKEDSIDRNVVAVTNLTGSTRHAKPRTFKTLEDAKNLGNASDDAFEVTSKRLVAGRMAQEASNIVDNFAKQFGSNAPKDKTWRELDTSLLRVPKGRQGNVKGVYFPPEAANYLEKAHALYTEPDKIDGAYKDAVRVFKSWAVTTPQQWGTNLFGNVVNAWMSDAVPLRKMAPALHEAHSIVWGKKLPPTIKNAHGTFGSKAILDAMKRYEVVGGSGQMLDITNASKPTTWNPLRTNNKLGRFSQMVNQHAVEEPFKVAGFLNALREGASLEQAALKIKNTFIDYAEISEPVRFLRDSGIMPFITWKVKNIPIQLENLALRPQKFAQTESVIDALNDDDTLVPVQDEREGMIATGPDEMTRFANPINDLNAFTTDPRFLFNDTLGSSVPWIRTPIELAFNKNIYRDKPIEFEGSEGVTPTDFMSRILGSAALTAPLAGIDPETGKQDATAAYVLRQHPLRYWERNLMSPPEELTDAGIMDVPPDALSTDYIGGLFGFRSKMTNPKDQSEELKRRMRMILEP
jgi:hypothetical protein